MREGKGCSVDGSSAAGKSHLCMVLALSAQLSSCTTDPGGSIIITSERELPTDRLIQLAKSSLASHREEPRPTTKQLLDNVAVTRCFDIDTLDHMLCYSLPWELEKRRKAGREIRLLILDSITALLRGGETTYSSSAAGLAQRSKHICAVADKLKALAVAYDLAVIVINQVSDVFNRQSQPGGPGMTQVPSAGGAAPSATQQPQPSQVATSSYGYSTQFYTDPGPEPPMLYATQARWFSGQSQGYKKEASLGIVWANAINTRVMVSRTGRRRRIERDEVTSVSRKRRKCIEEGLAESGAASNAFEKAQEDEDDQIGVQVDETTPSLIRKFHVVFSPFAPPSTVDYIITASGVHSLDESRKVLDLTSIVKQRQKRDKMLAAIAEDHGLDAMDKPVDGLGGEVYDDLDGLPAEFWDETLDGDEGEEE